LKPSNKTLENFKKWGINAKTIVATQFLWSIPMSSVFFYRPIFLSQSIGLTEIQIGFLVTIFNIVAVVTPLGGGYLADRYGRKRVLMIIDSLGWFSSLGIWIITKNIWYALIAYIMEGFIATIYSVWDSLIVEGTKPSFRASVFGSIAATSNVGALFTPVAGYLIGLYGVDFGVRVFFAITFVSLIPLFTIRQKFLKEPDKANKNFKPRSFAGIKGYSVSLSMIKRNRIFITLLLVLVVANLYNSVANYLPLFLIDNRGLGLRTDISSLLPAASSISALIIALQVIPDLTKRNDYFKSLFSGYLIGFLALLLLMCSPKGNVILVLLSGSLLGVYQAIFFSVPKTFLINEIDVVDSEARTKILSLAVMFSFLLNLVSPTIAGFLFEIEPRLPFWGVCGSFVICSIILVYTMKHFK
jgi:MFS family permease